MPPFQKDLDDDVVDRCIFIPPVSGAKHDAIKPNVSNLDSFSMPSIESFLFFEEADFPNDTPHHPSSFLDRVLDFQRRAASGVETTCGALTIPQIPIIPKPAASAIFKVRNFIEYGQSCTSMDGYVEEIVVIEEEQEEGKEVNITDFVVSTKVDGHDWHAQINEWRIDHSKSYMAIMHDLQRHFRALEEKAASTAALKANAEREAREKKEAEKRMREKCLGELINAAEELIIATAQAEHTRKSKGKKFGVLKQKMKNQFSLRNYSKLTKCVPGHTMLPKTTQGRKKYSSRKNSTQKLSTPLILLDEPADDHNCDENNISTDKHDSHKNKKASASMMKRVKNIFSMSNRSHRSSSSSSHNCNKIVKYVAVQWS